VIAPDDVIREAARHVLHPGVAVACGLACPASPAQE
jgi:hypothetical protein